MAPHQPDTSSHSEPEDEPLMGTEEEPKETITHDYTTHPQRPHWRRQSLFSLLSFLLGILLTSATFLLLTSLSPYSSTPGQIPHIASGTDEKTGQPATWFTGDCGRSASEARSRDCTFDLVSHSWLPKSCLTDEDIEDAKDMYEGKDWHWGLENLTEVSFEQVKLGEFDTVYTSMDWHVVHCSYIWKRLHRALMSGRMLDSYTADYHHTKHCVHMVGSLDPAAAINATGTQVFTKFPTCK